MSKPAVKDLEIYQGDTFEIEIRLREILTGGVLGPYIDLTGSTLRAQVRTTKASPTATEFTVTPWDQTQESTRGGATFLLTHLQTAALPPDSSLVWDMQRTDSQGKVRTLLRGKVALTGEVTR